MHLLQLIFFIFCFFNLALNAKETVRIKSFQGAEISPYTTEIVKFCNSLYREYPYLYAGDDSEYTAYLESYSKSPDAMICLAFDNTKVVGLAAGLPMEQTKDLYKQTLIQHGYDLYQLFYIGEFGVIPEYRHQGIEDEMYEKLAHFAKENNYNKLCVWELEKSSSTPPEGYVSKENLWKKLGFTRHNELNFEISWININETRESSHLAIYWIK